jgi:hypothetical protein
MRDIWDELRSVLQAGRQIKENPLLRGLYFTLLMRDTCCASNKKGKFIILYDTVHHIFLSFIANNVWALGCRFLKLNDRFRVDPPYRASQLNRFLAVNSLDTRYIHCLTAKSLLPLVLKFYFSK